LQLGNHKKSKASIIFDWIGETIQQLLISCVFTLQVWFLILQRLNFDVVAPLTTNVHISSWWKKAIRGAPKEMLKGLNSFIILVSWEVWKHRNSCVFEGATPNVNLLLQTVGDECALCCMAGASKLNEFLMRSPAHRSQVLRPKGSLFLFGCVFFSLQPMELL